MAKEDNRVQADSRDMWIGRPPASPSTRRRHCGQLLPVILNRRTRMTEGPDDLLGDPKLTTKWAVSMGGEEHFDQHRISGLTSETWMESRTISVLTTCHARQRCNLVARHNNSGRGQAIRIFARLRRSRGLECGRRDSVSQFDLCIEYICVVACKGQLGRRCTDFTYV